MKPELIPIKVNCLDFGTNDLATESEQLIFGVRFNEPYPCKENRCC